METKNGHGSTLVVTDGNTGCLYDNSCAKEPQKVGLIMATLGFLCYWLEVSWWRHQRDTFSALLVIRAGNSPVTSEFLTQRPVMRSFDVFFDLRLNKWLSKELWDWWFETPSCSLWRHYNGVTKPPVGPFMYRYMALSLWEGPPVVATDGLVLTGTKTLANFMRTYTSHSKQKAIVESCLWSWKKTQMLLLKLKHMEMDFHQCHWIGAIIHRHKSKENTDDKNAFCIRFVRMRWTHQSNASNIYSNGFTRIQHNRKRIWYSKSTNNIEWLDVHNQWYIGDNSKACLHFSDTRQSYIPCLKSIVWTIIIVLTVSLWMLYTHTCMFIINMYRNENVMTTFSAASDSNFMKTTKSPVNSKQILIENQKNECYGIDNTCLLCVCKNISLMPSCR